MFLIKLVGCELLRQLQSFGYIQLKIQPVYLFLIFISGQFIFTLEPKIVNSHYQYLQAKAKQSSIIII